MFRITQGRGFHMEFENGWTVSVQFGKYNYCDNQVAHESLDELFNSSSASQPLPYAPEAREVMTSPNAEIAAWDADGNWYDFGNDTVKGYVTPDEVLEFMNMISALPPAP
jgi:hypothetical protein